MAAKDIEKYKFKKGQTGNPNGRPKLPDLNEAMARLLGGDKDGQTALDEVLAALRKKALQGDVRAMEVLLNRGYGMPKQKTETQALDADGNPTNPPEVIIIK